MKYKIHFYVPTFSRKKGQLTRIIGARLSIFKFQLKVTWCSNIECSAFCSRWSSGFVLVGISLQSRCHTYINFGVNPWEKWCSNIALSNWELSIILHDNSRRWQNLRRSTCWVTQSFILWREYHFRRSRSISRDWWHLNGECEVEKIDNYSFEFVVLVGYIMSD